MTMESRIDAVLDEATGSGRIVGTVVIVARDGEIVYRRAAGLADREAGEPIREDAIFRLASVTKPYVAATALALVERGTLALDVPITEWLPDFRPKAPDGTTPTITLRHLLSHTSGLAYAGPEPDDPYRQAGISDGLAQPGLGMEENLRRIASVPLYFAPGTGWRYSVGIDVTGGIIEAATGKRLGESVADLVTRPLGIVDTSFVVADRARLATPYGEGDPPERMGETYVIKGELGRGNFYAPARCFDEASFHSGGAGMVGTAPETMRLLETFRSGGDGILKPGTMAEAARNQIGTLAREEKHAGWRFGLLSAVLDDPAAAKMPMAPGTLDWGGVYGLRWMVDLRNGISIATFTNTAVEGCFGDFPHAVRRAAYG